MKRGILGSMIAIAASSLQSIGNTNLAIKLHDDIEYRPAPAIKRIGMAPGAFYRQKANYGKPRRKKNLSACAQKAKIKRRNAAKG